MHVLVFLNLYEEYVNAFLLLPITHSDKFKSIFLDELMVWLFISVCSLTLVTCLKLLLKSIELICNN